MKIEFKETNRGFALAEFEDLYGHGCSLQKSSLATDDAIWFGVDDAEPKIMAKDTPQGGTGWMPFFIPDNVSLTTRMHLSQKQVRELLPAIIEFACSGELPSKRSKKLTVKQLRRIQDILEEG